MCLKCIIYQHINVSYGHKYYTASAVDIMLYINKGGKRAYN